VVVGEATRPDQGILNVELHADGVGAQELWVEAPASMFEPRLTKEMFDEGRHYPRMNGKQVFRWATEKMPEVAHSVVRQAGLAMADIDMFVPHQANMRINQMVAAKLGIPEGRVVHNIERYGNTTAATIPIGISESWREGKIGPGSRLLMAAFGAGFTWAGSVAVL
jgi:3-oxoacyl-[acyl-carrier-protein] synthase-3